MNTEEIDDPTRAQAHEDAWQRLVQAVIAAKVDLEATLGPWDRAGQAAGVYRARGEHVPAEVAAAEREAERAYHDARAAVEAAQQAMKAGVDEASV